MHPSEPDIHSLDERDSATTHRGRERRGGRDTVVISRKEQDMYLRKCGPGESLETHDGRRELDPELERMLLAF